jgi:hypothetical protein
MEQLQEELTPKSLFISLIKEQKEKEDCQDIWKNSLYKDLIILQSNNVGIIGEKMIQLCCDNASIPASIDGTKTKKVGGGCGDGIIKEKTIEIKTAHQGSKTFSFQHELGEIPWKSDYMIFIDISPECIYLTIFKNFPEEHYKGDNKCEPYFPSKSITWRKGKGAFKLDTSVKINEENIKKGFTIKITDKDFSEIGGFINNMIL